MSTSVVSGAGHERATAACLAQPGKLATGACLLPTSCAASAATHCKCSALLVYLPMRKMQQNAANGIIISHICWAQLHAQQHTLVDGQCRFHTPSVNERAAAGPGPSVSFGTSGHLHTLTQLPPTHGELPATCPYTSAQFASHCKLDVCCPGSLFIYT